MFITLDNGETIEATYISFDWFDNIVTITLATGGTRVESVRDLGYINKYNPNA